MRTYKLIYIAFNDRYDLRIIFMLIPHESNVSIYYLLAPFLLETDNTDKSLARKQLMLQTDRLSVLSHLYCEQGSSVPVSNETDIYLCPKY